jgi:hypothetical protein
MRYRSLVILVAALVTVSLTTWSGLAAGAQHDSAAKRTAKIILRGHGTTHAAPATAPILYSQYDNPNSQQILGQNFEVGHSTWDSQSADDFTVPPGQTWRIKQVDVAGFTYGLVPRATVEIYADSGGLPGTQLASVTRTPTQLGSGDLTIKLGSANFVTLTSGTYWVSVYADMAIFTYGEWGWTDRTVQSGQPAVFQEPGDGFGVGCPSWGNLVACTGASAPDMVFDLRGNLT